MNWSALDWGILGPALVAGLLVLATHVPLGQQVLVENKHLDDKGVTGQSLEKALAHIAVKGRKQALDNISVFT